MKVLKPGNEARPMNEARPRNVDSLGMRLCNSAKGYSEDVVLSIQADSPYH